MADHVSQLKRVPLFANISEAHLQRIANSAHERRYDPGAAIVSAGETGQGFYLIVQGRADVQRGGRTVRSLGPGEYFGELALLRDAPRSATVIAREPTTCLALTRWDFKGILDANPELALHLLDTVAQRVREDETAR